MLMSVFVLVLVQYAFPLVFVFLRVNSMRDCFVVCVDVFCMSGCYASVSYFMFVYFLPIASLLVTCCGCEIA